MCRAIRAFTREAEATRKVTAIFNCLTAIFYFLAASYIAKSAGSGIAELQNARKTVANFEIAALGM
jgi:hypothetical protein